MSQLFKKKYAPKKLMDFLKKICVIKNNHFTLTKDSYKRAQLLNILDPFLKDTKEHYFPSKQHYITRPMRFSYFVTIIRQLCKECCMGWASDISYDKSSYNMRYYIYFTSLEDHLAQNTNN